MTKKEIYPKFNEGDKVTFRTDRKIIGIVGNVRQVVNKKTHKILFEYWVSIPKTGISLQILEKDLCLYDSNSVDEEMGFINKCNEDQSYNKNIAERKNNGKPKYSWIPMNYLEEMIKGLEFGAAKYSKNDWKNGFPLSEIFDSILRHTNKILQGEFIDEESGLPHFGLIQCNAIFLANPNNINDIADLETDYYRSNRDEPLTRNS